MGQRIWLRDSTGAGYDADVIDVRDDAVVLARPADYPAFQDPQDLEALWAGQETMWALPLRVDSDAPEWVARPVTDGGPAQRRAHARIAIGSPMILVFDHVASDGILVDMSEAALRVRLDPDTAVPADGARVHVDVLLDGEAFVLTGHVHRSEKGSEGTEAAEIVVLFDGVVGPVVNRIRRALFFEQIRHDLLIP